MRKLKRLLTLIFAVLAALYLFLVLNVNVVFVPSDELEPSFLLNQILLISPDKLARAGDVVAFEEQGRVVLRRVFARGPSSVSCFKGIGYEDGQMKHFVQAEEVGDTGRQIGVIMEQWGTDAIPIKRVMKLVPVGTGAKAPVLEVPDGELLVGCQNRVSCGGCGFRSVSRESTLGRVRDQDHVYRWLTALVAYFR
ncbi:MAG: hypothetical protein ACPGQS_08765 [Bradymonadia bacterium]